MKIILPLLIVLTLICCSKPSEWKGEVEKADSTQTTLKENNQLKQGNAVRLDLDLIKANSQPRLVTFSVPHIDTLLKPIPASFLKQHIYPLQVRNLPGFSFPQDPYEQFYFHEYWETRQLFFFTFIHADESCCRSVYCVTINKQTNQITGVFQLGLNGGDGGWVEEDYGKWINDSTLQLVKAQFYEDYEEKVSIDTTWLEMRYNQRGQFHQTKKDSVHYEEKGK